MRPAQKEIMGPFGLQRGPQHCNTAAPALQPRGTLWPEQLQGEPHAWGMPTSVLSPTPDDALLGSTIKQTVLPKHHQTDPRHSTLPVMTKAKLVFAPGASLYSIAVGNEVRAWRVIQPVPSTV